MKLDPSQYPVLKAAIAGNTAQVQLQGTVGTTAINAVGINPGNCQVIADWYNQAASPTYKVWNDATPYEAIRAATDLSKYTPADNPPPSGGTTTITNDALLYQNRALKCQLQQFNAFQLIQGEGEVDATGLQFRQSFNDCMVGIPSGASGVSQNAGWGLPAAPGAVRLAMQRAATIMEKLYSVQAAGTGSAGNVIGDARGSNTNPDALVFVGAVSGNDVLLAMSS